MRYLFALLAVTPFIAPVAGQTPDEAAPEEPAETVTTEVVVEEEVAEEPPFDVLNNERLTGDWWGARTWLEDQGIEFGLSMTSVYQHNVHGGLQTRNGHRITGSVDYELTLDFGAMGLWDGGILYVSAESDWNDGIGGDRVGSLFGVNDDAAGDEEIIVGDLWYEHTFWDGKALLRLGRIGGGGDIDANAYANDETSQFLNSALVNIANIPAPDDGLGVQLVVQPVDWFYALAVANDGQAKGNTPGFNTTFHDEDYFFFAAEVGLMPIWETAWGELPGGYRLGIWYDPQPKDRYFNDLGGRRLTVPTKRDDVGFYFNMDQMVWKENPADVADTQGIGMFFRYSFAHEEANEIEHFWSIGGQYEGLIPTRDEDVLGFGFAQGILSSDLRYFDGGDRENVYELYYNAQVFPWLSVTPDFQYISNPGADKDGDDAFVAGLRLQMSF